MKEAMQRARTLRPLAFALAAVMALTSLAGCAQRPLPTFAWQGQAAATAVLARRAAEVRTVRAECSVYLAKPDGSTLGLEGALAAAPPDRMRLRTWKLGQAALDVTIRPGEIWIETPEGKAPDVKPDTASLPRAESKAGPWAAKFAEGWRLMAGGFFEKPADRVEDSSGATYMLFRRLDDAEVVCEVDRRTLVPLAYRVLDERGVTRFTLRLDGYAVYGDEAKSVQENSGSANTEARTIVWPARIVAITDSGRITIRLRDPEFNTDLPASVFEPPGGAVRQP
ncbi:MAG: hypothetical protein ACKVW3_08705 [Phycisphaerales bacterium]